MLDNEAVRENSDIWITNNFDDQDREYADFMQTLFTNFAKFGYVGVELCYHTNAMTFSSSLSGLFFYFIITCC